MECSCLLFVDPNVIHKVTRSAKSNPRGYALLFPRNDPVTKNSILLQALLDNGFAIVQDSVITPSQYPERFAAIEIKIIFQNCVGSNPTKFWFEYEYQYSCDSNSDMLRQLFDRSDQIQMSFSFNLHTPEIKLGDVNVIKKLLVFNPDMPFKGKQEGTLLHFAAERGQRALFNVLLELGADIHQKKKDGSTVLHSAISNKSYVNALLRKGADINAVNNFGATPLHIANRQSSKPIVSLLLKRGANINAVDSEGETALFYSCRRTEMLRFLVEKGANINIETTKGRTVLLEAIEKRYSESAEYILSLGPDTNVNGNIRAFQSVLLSGCDDLAECFNKMLQQGFTLSSKDAKRPAILYAAIKSGSLEMVLYALDNGATVNQRHKTVYGTLTPLHQAVRYNREAIVRLLFERNADVNAKPKGVPTPLYFAVQHASVEIVKLLFEATAGARSDHALLFVAVGRAKLDILKYLLGQGLDPTFTDKEGNTCMSFISYYSIPEVLNELAIFGARFRYAHYRGYLNSEQWFLERCPIDVSASELKCCDKVTGKHVVKIGAVVPELDALKWIPLWDIDKYNLIIFKRDCEAEAEKLDEQIAGSNVRYRDILTSDVQRVASFARNQSIVNEMNPKRVKIRFPIYSSLLVCKFETGVQRKNLVDQAKPAIKAIFYRFTTSHPLGRSVLADDVSTMIFRYLSNRDLIVMQKYLPAK